VLALAVRVLHLEHDLLPVGGHGRGDEHRRHTVRKGLAHDEPSALD
jgi:hypothetical protein